MNIRILSVCFLFFISCHSQLQVKDESHRVYRVLNDSLTEENKQVNRLIAPYKTKLDSLMNIRIQEAGQDLKKELPEGSLGNMVCDVLMRYANSQGKQPDFCILNYGGLRIPVLYKGSVYIRTIYELMPFDNQLVLLKVKGSKCLELFKSIAQNNGTPVSGIRMVLHGEMPEGISIQGKPFNPDQDYWILTSDYLANGNDKADALKQSMEYIDLQIMIRDALIHQMREMYFNGETLQSVKDGRITKN